MNIVGRFLAYKAMNAAWRSGTRKSSHSGASPTEPGSGAKTVLGILAMLGMAVLSMNSCVTGIPAMVGLGFVLIYIGVPAVYVAILFYQTVGSEPASSRPDMRKR